MDSFGQSHESMSSPETYYDVLNISPSANRTQVREAYIRMRDTFGASSQALYSLVSEEEARSVLVKVEEAFRVLNDDLLRSQYNNELGIVSEEQTGGASAVTDEGRDEPHHQVAQVRSFSSLTPQSASPTRAHTAKDDSVKEKMKGVIAEGDTGDGALLRKLREIAAVSEGEMQERTKISIEYIRAIESNTFDRLPKAVFVRGFIKSYLRYLDAPESDTVAASFSERLENWQLEKQQSR